MKLRYYLKHMNNCTDWVKTINYVMGVAAEDLRSLRSNVDPTATYKENMERVLLECERIAKNLEEV